MLYKNSFILELQLLKLIKVFLRLFNKLKKFDKKLKSKKIGILGVAFKSDIDDTRDSLSINLLNFLRSKSLKVNISDDYVKNKEIGDKIKLINESDIIILGVPHSSLQIKIPKNKFLMIAGV